MLTFKAHKKAVYGLAFSPDGRRLATSTRGEPVRLWNLSDLTETKQFPGGYFDPVIGFSPCGRFLGCCNDFRVWEIESGECLIEVENGQSVAFAPNGKEVATIDFGDTLSQWTLPKGELRSERCLGVLKQREPTGVLTYSPDSKNIAVVITIWDGKRPESHILIQGRNAGKPRIEIVTDFGDPAAISYSPDGSVIAGIYGPVLGVVNAKTGEKVAAIKPGKKHFKGFAFTPDGKRLIAVNTDATVRVYDTATWTETTGYEWQIGKLTAVAVAHDGLRAACGSANGRVVVWDLDA